MATKAEWADIKARYPETVVLIRERDRYVTFGADRFVVGETLGTTMIEGVAGHCIDNAIIRLMGDGHTVGVIEELRHGAAS